jgi:hypothetical protein
VANRKRRSQTFTTNSAFIGQGFTQGMKDFYIGDVLVFNDQKRYPILATRDVEGSDPEVLKRSGHVVVQGIRARL